VLLFVPSFKLMGIETNPDLVLPIGLATIIPVANSETPHPSQNINERNISLPRIIGISASALFFLILFISVAILNRRREQRKDISLAK
jgi:H+/gluconate symporter-like permease